MIFNKHLELKDKHAILSPSKPYWLNYTQDQIRKYIISQNAAARGTWLHNLAASLISEGTYKLKVEVTAAGNANFKKAMKTVTTKIIIK